MRKAELSLENCTKEVLKSLPPNIRVDGSLWFWDNKNLTSLPEGLKVGGNLFLDYCANLTSLPKGLKVGGWLDIRYCTKLESLLEGLEVGRYIWYNSGTGFAKIEGWEDNPDIIPPHLKDKLEKG